MFGNIKQLLLLAKKTDKLWMIPVILLLVIVALVVIGAQISPVPLFIYPIV